MFLYKIMGTKYRVICTVHEIHLGVVYEDLYVFFVSLCSCSMCLCAWCGVLFFLKEHRVTSTAAVCNVRGLFVCVLA